MALAYDGAIQRLIDSFASLPGIGPKGAQRIAFYLLQAPDVESQRLVDAINEVKEKVRFCEVCGNVCESSPCTICSDPRRDHSTICVVEEPKDVMSIERTREYRGLYQVLRARGVAIRVANQAISARRANGDEADLLGISRGGPVLTTERVVFNDAGEVVEYGIHCYRPDLYRFETTLFAK